MESREKGILRIYSSKWNPSLSPISTVSIHSATARVSLKAEAILKKVLLKRDGRIAHWTPVLRIPNSRKLQEKELIRGDLEEVIRDYSKSPGITASEEGTTLRLFDLDQEKQM